jgi:hypothetical protein
MRTKSTIMAGAVAKMSNDAMSKKRYWKCRIYHRESFYFVFLKHFLKRGCPGWGPDPGPLDFIYFLIFTTLPLSHNGSRGSFKWILEPMYIKICA